jgi:hypothetical protein
MRRVELAVCAGLLTSLALVVPVALHAASEKANRAKCADNMRNLALAAIQYADDKRFFPHVDQLTHLDQDIHSPDTPKIVRTLMWYGYTDDAKLWICPSSDDTFLPVRDPEIKKNPRLWTWGRHGQGDGRHCPLVQKGKDPNLADTTELSYGWTRRAMNNNVRRIAPLAADRAVRDGRDRSPLRGNHDDGWNVAQADGTVRFHRLDEKRGIGTTNAWLVGAQHGGAFLACKSQPQAHTMGGVVPRPAPTPWTGTFAADGKQLTLEARAWSERESSWSFKGELKQGETSQLVWGRVRTDDGALAGVVDGPKGFEELTVTGGGEKGVTLNVGGKSVELARTAAPTPAMARDDALREGVVRAFVSALRTHNDAAAEALLSRDMLAQLEGGWQDTMLQDLDHQGEAAFVARLLPHVRALDGTLKITAPHHASPPRTQPNRAAVVAALKTIYAAQSLFREADKDGNGELDYAENLQKLIDAGLIGESLAKGTSDGYMLEVCRSASAPEYQWMAVAHPPSGSPAYAVNQEGVIYQAQTEIKLDPKDCKIRGATPLGH